MRGLDFREIHPANNACSFREKIPDAQSLDGNQT
jgi:hypothetical protein